MTTLLATNLIVHVMLGVIGTTFYYMVWRDGLKKQPNIKWLQALSLSGTISYILAWISGGYYYLIYYGGAVKPIIKAGAYPWVHSVIMEAKEHVFFFLPILAIVVTLLWWILPDDMQQEPKLKQAVVGLSGVISLIGIGMILSGILISGAVR